MFAINHYLYIFTYNYENSAFLGNEFCTKFEGNSRLIFDTNAIKIVLAIMEYFG